LTPEQAEAQAEEAREKLKSIKGDHSIAEMFIQMAVQESSNPAADVKGAEGAYFVFHDIIPHYLASLQKPEPEPSKPEPNVVVTLVRWPCT
jgi:hypothetical protein